MCTGLSSGSQKRSWFLFYGVKWLEMKRITVIITFQSIYYRLFPGVGLIIKLPQCGQVWSREHKPFSLFLFLYRAAWMRTWRGVSGVRVHLRSTWRISSNVNCTRHSRAQTPAQVVHFQAREVKQKVLECLRDFSIWIWSSLGSLLVIFHLELNIRTSFFTKTT